MPAVRHVSRIDTLELRLQIERKVGQQKAEKYFNLLNRYLSGEIIKPEFDKVCIGIVGRENIRLHNELIKAILKNACFSKTPPPKNSKIDGPLNGKVPNGCQRSSLQLLCKDVFPQSLRKGRTPNLREHKFKDRPSPLGLHEKAYSVAEDLAHKIPEQQSATELLSLGSKPPVEVISVEEGEEVEQAALSPGIYSRSPVRAPLGISIHTKQTRKVLLNGLASSHYTDTCQNVGELPDTSSLENRLKQKLGMEGIGISTDCVNVLNNGLDVFLKRLIKASVALPASISQHKQQNLAHYPPTHGLNGMLSYAQKPRRPYSTSMLDFRATMELNPRLLGVDWPVQLEKVCLHASDSSVGTDLASKCSSGPSGLLDEILIFSTGVHHHHNILFAPCSKHITGLAQHSFAGFYPSFLGVLVLLKDRCLQYSSLWLLIDCTADTLVSKTPYISPLVSRVCSCAEMVLLKPKHVNIIFSDGERGITSLELYGFGFTMEFTVEFIGLLNQSSACVFKQGRK